MGPNYAKLKASGASGLGRRDVRTKDAQAAVFDHPDGHSDMIGTGQPKHHEHPHVHATNSKGETIIVTYPGAT